MWPFSRSYYLDREVIDWQLEILEWFIRDYGGMKELKATPLILPNREFFPVSTVESEALCHEMFGFVQKHADMADWPVELVIQPKRIERPHGVEGSWGLNEPLGTFSAVEENGKNHGISISVDPDLAQEPVTLVATLAHEFSHYLMRSGENPPPGGWEDEEPATDLFACYLGFGVFMANNAFDFQQYTDGMMQGWQGGRRGYLGERSFVVALAMFLKLTNRDMIEVSKHLKPHLLKGLKKAAKDLSEDWIAERLHKIEMQSD